MSENKKQNKPNVPNLRFPEFSGEYESIRIGHVTEKVGSGVTPKGGDSVYKKVGHPFVRSQNVGNGQMFLDDIAFIDEYTHNKQIATEIKNGDVLLNITGASIGRCCVATNEVIGGNVNQHVCIIRPKQDLLSSYYLCCLILSDKGQKQIDSFQAGGNRQGLNFEQIKSFQFSLPKLPEQKKVAQLLTMIDERISIQNKVIEKYESLIKALYESLIPCEGVDSVQLGSLVQICKGKQLNAELLSETGLYYVMNGGIFPSGYYDTYNTPQNIISISEGGNSCGYVQFNHKPFWSGGHCYTLLNPNENKVHYKYLFHFLKCHQDDIMALRIGSGLPNIQKKDIEKYPIALPNYETQVQLASLFDTINCKKENGIESLRQYKIMKSFLLSELFI